MKWIIRKILSLFRKKTRPSEHGRKPDKPGEMEETLGKLRNLWDSMEIKSDYWQKSQRRVIKEINDCKNQYEKAEALLMERHGISVPWQIFATIHSLESGLRWDRNLHNGQRWDQKTTIVPKGRGPFSSWSEAAMDALSLKRASIPKAWTIEASLDFLERYNGLGYRRYHSEVNTPYLWSGTNHYEKGKYVRDGKYDSSAVSEQIGGVLILKGLYYNGRSSQEL